MTKREIIQATVKGKAVPYTPWQIGLTLEAREKLQNYYGTKKIDTILQNHLCGCGGAKNFFENLGNGCVKDPFGVIWDRSIDKDIGIVKGEVLPEANLKDYTFPAPESECFISGLEIVSKNETLFRRYNIGFSLYERAWSLRGMENLMMDFYEHPAFVHELLDAIADHNIARVKKALEYDIDGVYFGDDWGSQHGLIMGPKLWKEFIFPRLKRMYATVKESGKPVFIHSCGDVDELFDDLYSIGLNCFNPFQPEVMNVYELKHKYKNKLAFHGGLSTQQLLPYGTVDEVKQECRKLIELGKDGGYIFAPAHAVEGDVPAENLAVMIELLLSQSGYQGS